MSTKYYRHPSLSKDGSLKASGQKTLALTNAKTREHVLSFKGHKHEINCSDFSFDGKYILSGSGENWSPYDFSVRIWNVKTGEIHAKFKSKSAAIIDAKFALDNKHVYILDYDQVFYIYSISQKKVIHTQRPKRLVLPTKGNTVGPDGRIMIDKELIISIIDSDLVFWDWNTGTLKHTLVGVYYFGGITFNEEKCTVIFNDQKHEFTI